MFPLKPASGALLQRKLTDMGVTWHFGTGVESLDAGNGGVRVTLTNGATFDAETGLFSWTPTFTQAANYTLDFTATDDGDGTGTPLTTSPGRRSHCLPLASTTCARPSRMCTVSSMP